MWNFLLEEERSFQLKAAASGEQFIGIIRMFNWQQLLQLFLDGIHQTGYEEGDDGTEDIDNSVSTRCAIALQALTLIINSSEVLHTTLAHVNNLLQQGTGDSWLREFIAIRIVNCTIEGPPQSAVDLAYRDVVPWLLGNTQH